MAEKTMNLRGLKCPLPALRTRKALSALKSGDLLVIECTDPLTTIDIPNLLNQTGDKLEGQSKDEEGADVPDQEEVGIAAGSDPHGEEHAKRASRTMAANAVAAPSFETRTIAR